ncbi:hypothetical protein COV23_00535 [Candidatus Wolfebacteria bacterium CG10_big_fil_rev_8_21_14_0_10_31_9]|uniref:Mur ligase central domain-containing protein n=1 Tax=Candidatus Wolfebacteria bacterium CG10_big_fil_rev_8_21_14_0_10_31_9 TaxID=1975070 RepID=A0A2H0RCQ4_9BACT|nr:MAG: hypothetical protein COV23_00535 [Candidatus Wolfebacteria bacterium CG10_big_fil_rev_8_21_14_0_10_31_9]
MRQFLIKILRKITKGIINKYNPNVVIILGEEKGRLEKEIISAVFSKANDVDSKFIKILENNSGNEDVLLLGILGYSKKLKGQKLKSNFLFLRAIIFGFFKVVFGSANDYPKNFILSYSDNILGDAKILHRVLKPKILIVNCENATEDIIKEDSRFLDLLSTKSNVILNFDDNIAMSLRDKTRANILTYGFSDGADIKISKFENLLDGEKLIGISFRIEYGGSFIPVVLNNVFDKQKSLSVAVGFAAGIINGMNLVEISELVEKINFTL